MIVLYYTKSSGSCRKASKWFKDNEIEVVEKNLKYISQKDLVHALSLSEQGFMDLLKCYSRSDYKIQIMIDKVLSMSFQNGTDFVLEHPEVLKAPIIFDEKKLMTGYNTEEIRMFLLRKQRRYNFYME